MRACARGIFAIGVEVVVRREGGSDFAGRIFLRRLIHRAHGGGEGLDNSLQIWVLGSMLQDFPPPPPPFTGPMRAM